MGTRAAPGLLHSFWPHAGVILTSPGAQKAGMAWGGGVSVWWAVQGGVLRTRCCLTFLLFHIFFCLQPPILSALTSVPSAKPLQEKGSWAMLPIEAEAVGQGHK